MRLLSNPSDDTTSRGFTLVELAIALMVIGLLIGGVLKGQELVENARVTATIRQIDAYKTAQAVFRNTYDSLPGDLKNPQQRLPDCTTAPCNVGGNKDGKIYNSTGPVQEMMNYFLHMAKAGMISGVNMDATTMLDITPTTPFGGQVIVQYQNSNASYYGTIISSVATVMDNLTGTTVIPVRMAAQMDRKMDDGNPFKGDVMGMTFSDPCTTPATLSYNEAASNGSCTMMFKMPD